MAPLAAESFIGSDLRARLALLQCAAALALATVTFISKSLDVSILTPTIGLAWSSALSAPFVLAGFTSCGAGIVLAVTARRSTVLRSLELTLAMLLLGSIIATTHATGRLEGRAALLAFSAMHQAGGAAWIGALPYFLLALGGSMAPATRVAIAHRFSTVCVIAVSAIAISAAAKYLWYLAAPAALYGTANGLMASTKALLFAALLCFGAGNFWAVRRMATDAGAAIRIRRFVEVEMVLGLAIYLVAGSLTSLPPVVDLPNDRVAFERITDRITPHAPRLSSPAHSELWYATEQERVNRLAQAAHENAPRAFVPSAGIVPVRTAADIGWSEFNHNWSGIFVLSIGNLALLAGQRRGSWARHWPITFVALGIFVTARSDPEAWPLGSVGFFEAMRDPSVIQHRLMAILACVFGFFEWQVRIGKLAANRAAYVFPITNIVGGFMLLTHAHNLENIQEALLIELSHIPLGLFAIMAGCARWMELRCEGPISVRAGRIWPWCFVAVGLILLFYRES
ncbi:MAG: CopD family protein [Gammaproteobacteria bacterium]|nr:CopD family protein [Gammaproteobacteria bacterium]